jgi:hypothetical protein
VTATAFTSSAAFAAPVAIAGNTRPYFQYNNAEQTSLPNSIVALGGSAQGNYGIFQLTNIVIETVVPPTGSDIPGGGGAPVFSDQLFPAGAQILGIALSLLRLAKVAIS